ncbi:MAG: flavin-containing monooxygenase [Burkholderiales bacterium]
MIGGGPAGLSTGYELGRRGVAYEILEQGPRAGYSWTRMPQNLRLLSPWKANVLRGSHGGVAPRHALVSRDTFADYLARYADSHRLQIATSTQVTRVLRLPGGGFALSTNRGELCARWLINATGYFFNPRLPTFLGAATECSIPQVHAGEYFNPERLRGLSASGMRRVLVVGKGISSGQTATELHDAGFEVTISHRGRMVFGFDPWVLAIAFHFYFLLEDIAVRVNPYFRRNSFPPMEGGHTRRLIESGRIRTRPDIARLAARDVVFSDGRSEPFDVIVYATGYRPALRHLEGLVRFDEASGLPAIRKFESTEAPGLYFVGLDMQRNYRSRYLRGIREDAALLADIIARGT